MKRILFLFTQLLFVNIGHSQCPSLSFNHLATTPSNCGVQNGSYIIEAQNGAAPYTYYIHTQPGATNPYTSNPQNNGHFYNLYSGLYTLVATDANGCMDSTFIVITEELMIPSPVVTQNLTCYHSNDGIGQASILIGGVAPITYTLTSTTGFQIGPQLTGSFSGLPAGVYTITMTDNGSCVNDVQFALSEPDSIQFNATATDVSCPSNATNGANDGAITISNPVGGANTTYQYSIDGGINYQLSPIFTNLPVGTYTLFVSDPNGCVGQSTIDVNQPADINVTAQTTDLNCNGNCDGQIQIIANGGTPPYLYSINAGTNYYASPVFNNLCASTYNLNVTDTNGCIDNLNTTVTLTEPNPIVNTVTANGVVLSSNETNANAQYQWIHCGSNALINGETGQFYTATQDGGYAVIVTVGNCSDTSTCTQVSGVGLNENNKLSSIKIYPNPSSGQFMVWINSPFSKATITVLDINGKLIVEKITSKNQTSINISNIDSGIYFVKINTDNGVITKKINVVK